MCTPVHTMAWHQQACSAVARYWRACRAMACYLSCSSFPTELSVFMSTQYLSYFSICWYRCKYIYLCLLSYLIQDPIIWPPFFSYSILSTPSAPSPQFGKHLQLTIYWSPSWLRNSSLQWNRKILVGLHAIPIHTGYDCHMSAMCTIPWAFLLDKIRFGFMPYRLPHYGCKRPTSAVWLNTFPKFSIVSHLHPTSHSLPSFPLCPRISS